MSEQSFEPDPLDELREIAAAAEKLAEDEESFVEAFDAHAASDAGRFQAALERAGIADRCDLICVYFCVKRCVGTCVKLCPERPTRAVDAKEVLEFTHAIARVAKDRRALERLTRDRREGGQEGLGRRAEEARADALLPPGLPLRLPDALQARLPPSLRKAADHADQLDPDGAVRRPGLRARAQRAPFPGAAPEPGSGGR